MIKNYVGSWQKLVKLEDCFFQKGVTNSPQHGDHLGHPKKIIYTFTSIRDLQTHVTNMPGVLLLIWMD